MGKYYAIQFVEIRIFHTWYLCPTRRLQLFLHTAHLQALANSATDLEGICSKAMRTRSPRFLEGSFAGASCTVSFKSVWCLFQFKDVFLVQKKSKGNLIMLKCFESGVFYQKEISERILEKERTLERKIIIFPKKWRLHYDACRSNRSNKKVRWKLRQVTSKCSFL